MAKKERKRRGRKLLKTVFNPRGWMSYDDVKKGGQNVRELLKTVTEETKAGRKETFEQAIKRMKLSEQDIQTRMNQLYMSSLIYACVAFLVLIYSFVSLFIFGSFWAFLAAAIVGCLGFALSFRDSFFYFQMKRRKLGCTVNEWIQFVTGRGVSKSKDLK